MLIQHHHAQSKLLRGLWSVPVAALFLLSPANASAQCETDADCEFGFRCEVGSYSNTSSSTTGGVPFCGDGFCEVDEETECPEDCESYGYCVGAACQSNTDCAEGYACLTPSQVYSTSTTGSSGPFCGNTVCEEEETEESCYSDCTTETTCQPAGCQVDNDCPEGHYCAVMAGAVSSGASSSDGTSGFVTLYQNMCLPLSTDGGGSGGAIGGNGSNGSDTTGSAGAAGDNGETSGGDGSSAVTSVSNVASATSGGSASGGSGGSANQDSGSGGAGHGHGGGRGGKFPWPKRPGHGCSFSGHSESPSSPWPVALAAALGLSLVRRRRAS